MILVDFSSIIHRKIFTSITGMRPRKENGKYITSDFIDYTKYQIFDELFSISREFGPRFGELVICLDNKSPEGYWRKDVLPSYKAGRSKGRQESDIDFITVWPEINLLTEAIVKYLPWKCVEVHRAEADDVILVLADEFTKFNPVLDYTKTEVLIHSPDKDMIQAQIGTDSVKQYSALTNKWIVPETKSSDMSGWILEHICLGDAGDEVPKIVDWTEFSDSFREYLIKNDINILDPLKFKNSDISIDTKRKLVNEFDVYKLNRAGEPQEKDIYKTIRFGSTTLTKAIDKHGSLDNFLDSNPLYRIHYERNRKLVLTEGIPPDIRESVLVNYQNASADYKHHEFEQYLNENNLSKLIMELPHSIASKRGESTIEDLW